MRREGTVTVLRAGIRDDGILTLRRLVGARRRDGRGRPPLLCSSARLVCSRFRFEQLAPHVEERPTDEHGSPEQDESGNDGHRDRYAGKPRDEAHTFTTNITHGHGGLLKRQPAYLKAARQGKAPQDETIKHYIPLLASRRGGIWRPRRSPQRRCDEADTPWRCRCSFGSARGCASGGRSGDTRREVRGC